MNNEEKLIEKYLGLIIKHFNLTNYDFWEFEDIDGVFGYKIAYN